MHHDRDFVAHCASCGIPKQGDSRVCGAASVCRYVRSMPAATTQRAAVCKRPYKYCKLEYKFVNQQSEWAFASGTPLNLV